jgi:hypothetical protein
VSGEFNICSVCKLVRYCSRNCQKKHWDEHKTLCTAIKNIYTSTERGLGDSADENVFISHLTPSQRNTEAKLVGEKCHVRCELNGIETDVLWDTGAQVSISVVVESTTYESKSESYTFKSEYEFKSLAKFQVQTFQVRVLNISSPSPK